ncbi:proton-conducting transporter membrane subunit [Nostocoides sp.]|uniref:proton-conducting transporter transmembrane domain-containing protein n=1 Tax=Nostocoides sp. TaxID=1917966 RepID=UPI002C5AA166|nr:proton-conducting transporter membrane subunit [Tetrasphaera sp.]
MSGVSGGIAAQLLAAGGTVLVAILAPARLRSLLAGSACVALGIAGVATGLVAMFGAGGAGLRIPVALPLGVSVEPLVLAPDRLGGVFMALAGAVAAVTSLYGIGYARGAAASRSGWAAFAVFAVGMQLVPAASDAVSFLAAWETMAIGSTVLLLADHEARSEVVRATQWYAVMTHASFLLLLAGFAVLGAEAGGTSFATIEAAGVSGGTASVAFVLLLGGFATKAGLVPVHVWLPLAHPEAPSHVSAAMSAAMVKMGVYGLLLAVLRLLPPGPAWWGVLLLCLALASALYGILQASVATDLKRLLAYSTTENVGLIMVAVAVALLLRGAGDEPVADVALTAALLLALSHAAFKTLLFLGAGAIVHATGERDLDRLGGLARVMPTTSLAFGVAALGAAALPVTSGFAAEWALLQSLIHGDGRDNVALAILLPVAVAVVALTAGLALLTFVKAYGIAFLARPRSDAAAHGHEVGSSMRVAMLLCVAAVVGLGLAPGPVAAGLASAVGADGIQVVGVLGVSLPAVDALLDPVSLVLLAAVVLVPVLVVHAASARRAPRRDVDLAWGCGGVRASPRMQYTATSYAEPLVRVFDDALQPRRDLLVSHADESRYLVSHVRFRQQVTDVVADRVYEPLVRIVLGVGEAARRIQNGSIHRYLGFSFTALVLVLMVVTW